MRTMKTYSLRYFPILYIYVKSLCKDISHDRASIGAKTGRVLVSQMRVDY